MLKRKRNVRIKNFVQLDKGSSKSRSWNNIKKIRKILLNNSKKTQYHNGDGIKENEYNIWLERNSKKNEFFSSFPTLLL